MAKMTDLTGRPFSGIIDSAVIGIVDDIDDPEQLGRIRVKFKTLDADPVSWWLRQVAPNAGKERGLYAIPEVGDEVLVIFLYGSQDMGVILGQFWNGVDVIPPEAKGNLPGPSKTNTGGKWSTSKFSAGSGDYAKNDVRFWRSRAGHLFLFDDTGGSESVQVWDYNHNLALVFDSSSNAIYLTNSQGEIHIRAKGDILIDSGANIKAIAKQNIEIESGMDTVAVAGMKIEVESKMDTSFKAGMNFKIEATMNLEGKASMQAKFEGSMSFEAKGGIQAKLEGSAMAVVKGGIVMIN